MERANAPRPRRVEVKDQKFAIDRVETVSQTSGINFGQNTGSAGNFTTGQPGVTNAFGAPTTTSANAFGSAPGSTANNLFGNTTNTAGSTGFNFGNTGNTSGNTGGFSFGGATSTTAPATSTGFSFGNTSTPAIGGNTGSTGFSFGSTGGNTGSTGFSFGS